MLSFAYEGYCIETKATPILGQGLLKYALIETKVCYPPY